MSLRLQEVKIVVDSEKAEELADLLLEKKGALSVGISDAYAETGQEQPLFDEPGESENKEIQLWDNSLILSLFREVIDAVDIVKTALRELNITAKLISATEVEEKDWVRLTQSQFHSIPISDRLWIVPSWRESADSVEHVIHLDPGLAFGTGSHPTTFLCLTWLDEYLQSGQSVLDYGCGSGILAIVATKLGAGTVVGVDIDTQAISASYENASNNDINIRFYLPEDFQLKEPFDVVVANILSNPLRVLSDMLASYVKIGGHIVLSGILKSQAEEIMQIYRKWFDVNVYQEKEGWVCLSGVKR